MGISISSRLVCVSRWSYNRTHSRIPYPTKKEQLLRLTTLSSSRRCTPTSLIDIQLPFPDIQFLFSARIEINLVHKVQVRIEQSEIVDALQDIDEDPIRQILISIVIWCASAPFSPLPSLLKSGAEHHSSPVALTVDANEDGDAPPLALRSDERDKGVSAITYLHA